GGGVGLEVGYCEGNFGIYSAGVGAGLVYALLRGRIAPLPWPGFAALLLPIALDGLTQLTGARESDWLLRTLTGVLAGGAGAWLVYPRVDRALRMPAPATADRMRARLEAECPTAARPLG